MIFPHDLVRLGQKELIETITAALKEKKHVLAHAPTGLGKTAAALFPALDLAMQRDLTVFFLTSRHTQHKIVLETIQKVREKNKAGIVATSLIGKKWMCAQENVAMMPSGDFTEYCKTLVEGNKCEFYTNARGENKVLAKKVLADLKAQGPMPTEQVMATCIADRVCPYEMSLMLAEESKVVIADYYYLFHPSIRDALLGKIKKKLDQIIVIVDEGHNLPSRLRDLLTFRLSNKMTRLAIAEAKKHGLEDVVASLAEIQEVLNKLSENVRDEKLVKEDQFTQLLEKFKQFETVATELELAAEVVREDDKASHIGSVAKFLREWQRKDAGFARMVSKKDMVVTLSNRCLDPALLTKNVFDNCYASVVMSGTLSPTSMYADVLGLKGAVAKTFESPFPEKNRKALIVPRTTTKYSLRSDRQFKDIGEVCADIANKIPGCIMVFLPSYFVRDAIEPAFSANYKRHVFFERPGMEKDEKEALLRNFASHAKSGAVLLAVAAGSFGEGVDLPGVLKGVIVAGLPLDRPDLETTELIAYYDKKFGKGWEYGYILPAMTRCIQNAGRCIRSEKDRGVLIFLDERYAWPRYSSCFPPEWNMKITQEYDEEIAQFFGRLF